MNEYTGHDKPYPHWFPIVLGGAIGGPLLLYILGIIL